MRILIAAGGTGGHVYPALAVAEAIRQHQPHVELAFVSGRGDFARPLIEEAGIPFEPFAEVHAGPFHGVSPLKAARSLVIDLIGTVQSARLLRRLRPGAILLTGGWVGLPVALAGRLLGIPSLIYLPDIEPGLAINVLKRFASRVAVTTADSQKFFAPGQTVVTGYPLRSQMLLATREAGMAHFSLDPARRTLLIFGGSRGARSINHAAIAIASELVALGAQVIHVTGTLDADAMTAAHAALPPETRAHYHLFPYLHDAMGLAMACADLCVCRSGASTLGELPFFGLPSILVPYPHAWRYQKVNADWLADRGAGIVMPDDRLSVDLLPAVRDLLGDAVRLSQMAAQARSLAQPDGAWNVGRELLRLAGASA